MSLRLHFAAFLFALIRELFLFRFRFFGEYGFVIGVQHFKPPFTFLHLYQTAQKHLPMTVFLLLNNKAPIG